MIKNNKRFKRIIVWLCICMVCFINLIGCQNIFQKKEEKVSNKTNAENQKPLLIFYESGTYNMVLDYQQSHPEVKIKIKQVHFSLENDELTEAIENYGQPDIILLGENEFEMLKHLNKQNFISDINPLLVEDESVDASQYFTNTFEVFQAEEGLLALPLGVSFQYMTLREENWQLSSLANLPEQYTAKELLNKLIEEAKKPREKDWYLEKNVFGGSDIIEWMYQVGGIWKENGYMQVDEEMLETIYTYCYLLKCNQNETDEYYEHYEQEAAYDEDKFVCASGLDHEVFNGKVLIDMWKGAPQIGLVYAKSTNMDQCSQETYAYWIPKTEEKDEYLGKVNICGAVGAQSSQQQQAYQVLRQMMDMKPKTWIQPMLMFAKSGRDYCPVNLNSAKRMIEDYNALNSELEIRTEINEVMYTMNRQKLNEHDVAQLNNLLEHVSGLYVIPNLSTDEKFLLEQCLEKENADCHQYYELLVSVLNKHYI